MPTAIVLRSNTISPLYGCLGLVLVPRLAQLHSTPQPLTDGPHLASRCMATALGEAPCSTYPYMVQIHTQHHHRQSRLPQKCSRDTLETFTHQPNTNLASIELAPPPIHHPTPWHPTDTRRRSCPSRPRATSSLSPSRAWPSMRTWVSHSDCRDNVP